MTIKHPTLMHPRTGQPLEAVGVVAGKIVWPIMGGDGSEEDANDSADESGASTDNDGQENAETDTDASQEAEGDQGTEGGEGGDDESQEGSSTLSLEDALAALKATRKESAEKRLKVKELTDALADANATAEEKAKAAEEYVNKVKELEGEVLRARVAREHSLPDALADLLRGEDEDSVRAHAKELSQYVVRVTPDDDLRGGLDSGTGGADTETDPGALAAKYKPRY